MTQHRKRNKSLGLAELIAIALGGMVGGGIFTNWLSVRKGNSPQNSIIALASMASILVVIGGLELILEFGSITFLLVSLLMAVANYKIKDKTDSSKFLTILSIIGLGTGGVLILYYEFTTKWEQMIAIITLYIILAFGAWKYSKKQEENNKKGYNKELL